MCFYSILIPKDQRNIDLFSFGSRPLLFSLLPLAPHELKRAVYEMKPNCWCVVHSREGHFAKTTEENILASRSDRQCCGQTEHKH